MQVDTPGGMEVINTVINDMIENTDKDDWSTVTVAVAPSTVSVAFHDGRESMECRVRFLSFLGIGQNVQQCAFIMHTAQVISTRNASFSFHWLLSHNGVLLLVGCSAYCSRSTCPDFKLFLNAQTDKIVSILLKTLCRTWLGHEMSCQMLTHCRPGRGTQYPSSLSSNFTNSCHLDGHLVPFRELIEIVNEKLI